MNFKSDQDINRLAAVKAVINQQTEVNKIWEYREPPAAIGKHEVL